MKVQCQGSAAPARVAVVGHRTGPCAWRPTIRPAVRAQRQRASTPLSATPVTSFHDDLDGSREAYGYGQNSFPLQQRDTLHDTDRWRSFRSRTVWVMGLPEGIKWHDVRDFMARAGEVAQTRLGSTPGGAWSGIARVLFQDAASTVIAEETLSGKLIGDSHVMVIRPRDDPDEKVEANGSVSPSESEPLSDSLAEVDNGDTVVDDGGAAEVEPEQRRRRRFLAIAVLNLPEFWNRSQIMGLLAPFGRVTYMNNRLYSDGTPRQWIKARFASKQAAQTAIDVLSRLEMDGNRLHAKWDRLERWGSKQNQREDEGLVGAKTRWILPSD